MDERFLNTEPLKPYQIPQIVVVEFEGPNVLLNDSGSAEIDDDY